MFFRDWNKLWYHQYLHCLVAYCLKYIWVTSDSIGTSLPILTLIKPFFFSQTYYKMIVLIRINVHDVWRARSHPTSSSWPVLGSAMKITLIQMCTLVIPKSGLALNFSSSHQYIVYDEDFFFSDSFFFSASSLASSSSWDLINFSTSPWGRILISVLLSLRVKVDISTATH